jgi:hypothetical protein
MLLDVPTSVGASNPAYLKFVETGMRRHKMLFKILSVQQTKMNITIEDFARSLGESASIRLFHTMLDLRGIASKPERAKFAKEALEVCFCCCCWGDLKILSWENPGECFSKK